MWTCTASNIHSIHPFTYHGTTILFSLDFCCTFLHRRNYLEVSSKKKTRIMNGARECTFAKGTSNKSNSVIFKFIPHLWLMDHDTMVKSLPPQPPLWSNLGSERNEHPFFSFISPKPSLARDPRTGSAPMSMKKPPCISKGSLSGCCTRDLAVLALLGWLHPKDHSPP